MKRLRNIKIRLLCFSYLLSSSFASFAQTPGEWTWMHGDNTPNSLGVFGIQGVSNPANKPPALYEPCEWTDHNGNFWLFGGTGAGTPAAENSALWKYDVASSEWTWMKGPAAVNQPGVYGTQGISSPANYPGARGTGAFTWTDVSGNLWLFGGVGYDAFGVKGYLNDLWKYDIATNEWTWMKGPNTFNDPGSYGTLGMPASTNLPPSRNEGSCSWTDNGGNLWLYGGGRNGGYLGDLWKYTITTNEWTWMHGANTLTPPPVYGTKGVAAPGNTPGGRWVYGSWTDQAGNLWLFAGAGLGIFSDLWKYDIAASQWTWMNGSNSTGTPGNYGTRCIPAASNMPGARFENRARVRDACGNFWNIGGSRGAGYFNDLWHYNVSTNEWNWVSGDNITNQQAIYGMLGVSSPANKPGSRYGNVAWMDTNGSIWVFGGASLTGIHNDLFRFVPDPACMPSSGALTITPNTTICPGQGATLTVSGGSNYLWSNGQTTSSITLTPGTTTTYSVVASAGACSDTAVATITVNPGPMVNAGMDITACTGTAVTLTASGGAGYSWSSGQTTSSVIVTPATTTGYTVIATDANGCTGIDSVTAVITPSIVANAGPDISMCAGESVILNASGGTGYDWFPSSGLSSSTQPGTTASPSVTTQYTVVVTSGSCPPATDSVTVYVKPAPAASAWSNVTITAGNSATLSASGGATYAWNNGSITSTIAVAPAATTVYCVTVTDANGCTDSECITVFVEQTDCSSAGELYLPNAFSPNGDGQNDVLKVYYGNYACLKTFKLIIYNRWGEKVFETSDPAAGWDGKFRGKYPDTAVFTYFLKATLSDSQQINKKGSVSLLR